jgi:hypothetical protein
MSFEALWKAAQDGELILIDDGFCHYHLRRDGQLTIAEIISLQPGVGSIMLEVLKGMNKIGATCIVAKCPVDLESNKWYQKRGFKKVALEYSKTGRGINVWRLELPPYKEVTEVVAFGDGQVEETTTALPDHD